MKPVGEMMDKYRNIVLHGFDPVSAGGFTQVPNIVLKSPLPFSARVVYSQLLSYAWYNNYVYPGQERMAADLYTSQPTINRALRELQDTGWLRIDKRGQGKTNVYTLYYVVNKARVVDNSVTHDGIIHG